MSLPALRRMSELPPWWAVYPAEVASAITSMLLVAPFITIVDKAIFSNASGKEPLVLSLKNSTLHLLKHPWQFIRSPAFRWIWFVYGGTYSVANCVERAWKRAGKDYGIPKFIASSAANISLSVTKDRAFSRMFGTVAPRPVPILSMLLYGSRDAITIAGSFNMPVLISRHFQDEFHVSQWNADTSAQLIMPCVAQIVNTPLHLTGMDCYNNPQHRITERCAFIKREYTKTLLARWGRIFPAFGIGGFTNKYIRDQTQHMIQLRFPAIKDPVIPLYP